MDFDSLLDEALGDGQASDDNASDVLESAIDAALGAGDEVNDVDDVEDVDDGEGVGDIDDVDDGEGVGTLEDALDAALGLGDDADNDDDDDDNPYLWSKRPHPVGRQTANVSVAIFVAMYFSRWAVK